MGALGVPGGFGALLNEYSFAVESSAVQYDVSLSFTVLVSEIGFTITLTLYALDGAE